MKKIMLLVFLGLFVFFVSNVSALAPNCIIDTRQMPSPPPNIDRDIPGMTRLGYVSGQGHYSNTYGGDVTFSHALFCFENFTDFREDGEPAFKFSDPNTVYTVGGDSSLGSGHVALFDSVFDFRENASVYFGEDKCTIRASCQDNEVCVAKISGSEQGHLADCDDNRPVTNDYRNMICCEPTEYCRDDIDNTGDGLVDCASPQCHPSPQTLGVPQECTNNTQRSDDCVVGITAGGEPIFNPACVGPHPTLPENIGYYCSYGFNDDGSDTGGKGFCCPEGTYYDADTNTCEDFQVCGLTFGLPCNNDFNSNRSQWLGQLFGGDMFDWCHSHIPQFRPSSDRSEACCLTIAYGNVGYYVVDKNVKIFGE